MKARTYQYFFLVSGLALGLFGFFAFAAYPQLRMAISIAIGIFYFGWGVIHHSLEKSLHIKIVLEYLLIAILAVAVLISLILRA